jgi:hypothetical protein
MMWIILIWIIPIVISLIIGYYGMNKGESVNEFLIRTTLGDYPLFLLFIPISGVIISAIILYIVIWNKKIKQWRK